MNKAYEMFRVSLGGAVWGSFLGIFAGALLGALYGGFVGDVSLGLDGALLGGGAGCLGGAGYGAVLVAREGSSAKSLDRTTIQKPSTEGEGFTRPKIEVAQEFTEVTPSEIRHLSR
jgi:hypothetical protein